MNISRFVAWALLTFALPALAQPDAKPGTELPYPKVTPEDAAKLGLTEKPMQFHLRDVTLSDALEKLQKQSGIQIDKTWSGPNDALQKKLSLDLETRSFNEAFAALLKAADTKAYLQNYSSNKGLSLSFGEDDQLKDALLSGTNGFQLRLQSVDSNSSKSVSIKGTAAPARTQSNNLSVNLVAVNEPQLSMVGSPHIRLVRVDDDKGRSLRPEETPSAVGNFYNYGQQNSISLLSPQADAKTIAHLEGVTTYLLSSKREMWEVPDLLKAKNVGHSFQSNGQNLQITLRDAAVTTTNLTVNVRLTGPATNDEGAASGLLFIYNELVATIRLTDAKGRALQLAGYGGGSSDNQLTLNASFSLPPSQTPPAIGMDGKPMDAETPTLEGPIKLTFNVPTEFVQTQVPFSFHDLPLP